MAESDVELVRLRSDNERLHIEIIRLREALGPFAYFGKQIYLKPTDGWDGYLGTELAAKVFPQDFLIAYAAIKRG